MGGPGGSVIAWLLRHREHVRRVADRHPHAHPLLLASGPPLYFAILDTSRPCTSAGVALRGGGGARSLPIRLLRYARSLLSPSTDTTPVGSTHRAQLLPNTNVASVSYRRGSIPPIPPVAGGGFPALLGGDRPCRGGGSGVVLGVVSLGGRTMRYPLNSGRGVDDFPFPPNTPGGGAFGSCEVLGVVSPDDHTFGFPHAVGRRIGGLRGGRCHYPIGRPVRRRMRWCCSACHRRIAAGFPQEGAILA